MNRAVFLDRDGVINQVIMRHGRPGAPTSPEELVILPGVAQAIGALRRAHFRTIIVTNQPDVAVGRLAREQVEAIHAAILRALPIDGVKTCYHADRDGCACRKPKPGMLLEAAREWELDLARSFMVGDRWRDTGAGKAAGCTTILVGDGYGEPQPERPDAAVESLLAASELILSGKTLSVAV